MRMDIQTCWHGLFGPTLSAQVVDYHGWAEPFWSDSSMVQQGICTTRSSVDAPPWARGVAAA